MKIDYSILTPSKMLIEYHERKTIVKGEATLTPAFYADVKSIKRWEPPHDKEEITEEERAELIRRITEESQKEGRVRVYFE